MARVLDGSAWLCKGANAVWKQIAHIIFNNIHNAAFASHTTRLKRREMKELPHILVDADACPVKEEVYKVAFRTQTPVTLVANQPIRIPRHELLTRITVGNAMDAADDWIADNSSPASIVITADILLADRSLKAGAIVIAPNGKLFTVDSIGSAIATRAIMADLRAGAEMSTAGGPAPFRKEDRSRFLSALDEALVRLKRNLG